MILRSMMVLLMSSRSFSLFSSLAYCRIRFAPRVRIRGWNAYSVVTPPAPWFRVSMNSLPSR